MAVNKRTLFIGVGVSLAVIVAVAIVLGVLLTKETVKQDPPSSLPASGTKLNTSSLCASSCVSPFRCNRPAHECAGAWVCACSYLHSLLTHSLCAHVQSELVQSFLVSVTLITLFLTNGKCACV